MLTETTTTQDQLVEIFELPRWAPLLLGQSRPKKINACPHQRQCQPTSTLAGKLGLDGGGLEQERRDSCTDSCSDLWNMSHSALTSGNLRFSRVPDDSCTRPVTHEVLQNPRSGQRELVP